MRRGTVSSRSAPCIYCPVLQWERRLVGIFKISRALSSIRLSCYLLLHRLTQILLYILTVNKICLSSVKSDCCSSIVMNMQFPVNCLFFQFRPLLWILLLLMCLTCRFLFKSKLNIHFSYLAVPILRFHFCFYTNYFSLEYQPITIAIRYRHAMDDTDLQYLFCSVEWSIRCIKWHYSENKRIGI